MFCVHCGAALDDDARFCVKCGEAVEDIETAGHAPTCANCGEPLEEGAQFCIACGAATKGEDARATILRCPQCGNPLEDGARFCTACGCTVDTTGATAKMAVAQEAPAANVETHSLRTAEDVAGRKRSKLPVIAAVAVIAVVLIALAVVFLLLPQLNGDVSSSGTDGSSSVVSAGSMASSAASQPTLSSSTSESASLGTAASSASSSTASQGGGAVARGDSAPDEAGLVSNAEARKTTNLFLSNFTEVALGDFADVSSVGDTTLVHFALAHDGLNSPEYWETGAGSVASSSGRELATRESAARVDELLTRYFGTTASRSAFASYLAYENGYYYFDPSAVSTSPQGVASVTGSENLGNNRMKVYFNVYAGAYDATDQMIYGGTQDEIMRQLGASQAIYKGVAVIRTGGSNEQTGGMTLESFERLAS